MRIVRYCLSKKQNLYCLNFIGFKVSPENENVCVRNPMEGIEPLCARNGSQFQCNNGRCVPVLFEHNIDIINTSITEHAFSMNGGAMVKTTVLMDQTKSIQTQTKIASKKRSALRGVHSLCSIATNFSWTNLRTIRCNNTKKCIPQQVSCGFFETFCIAQ